MSAHTLTYRLPLLDINGDPIVGGTIDFFEAGGSATPKEVWSNDALSTSAGVSVDTDSYGMPENSGTSITVYGDGDYYVVYNDATGTPIDDFEWTEGRGSVPVANVVALKLKEGSFDGQWVELEGYYSIADGGGGKLYWDATSTETADDGMIFQVTGVTAGRWKRLIGKSFSTSEYGCKFDDTFDDTTQLAKAIAYQLSSGIKMISPAGTAKVTSGFLYQTNGSSSGIDWEGQGSNSTAIKAYGTFNDSILEVDGSSLSPGDFQFGGGIKGISFIKDAAATGVTGLTSNGWWYPKFTDFKIDSLDGDGIIAPTRDDININPDLYASIGWSFFGCVITNMDGWGIKQDNSIGASFWKIDRTKISSNGLGGCQITGHENEIKHSGLGQNGYGASAGAGAGLSVLKQKGNTPIGLSVLNTEFDANRDAHWIIDELVAPCFKQNRLITNDRRITGNQTPPVHMLIKTSMAQAEVNQNFHRIDANIGAVELYKCESAAVGLNTTNINIHNFKIQNDASATVTELVNFDDKTNIDSWSDERQISSGLRKPVVLAKYLSATLTTGVSITGTHSILVFDNQDSLGIQHTEHYNTGTGEFTAPYEGAYRVRVCLTFDTWTASNRLRLSVYVNGVNIDERYWLSSSTTIRDSVYFEAIVKAVSGETIDVRASVTGASETLSNATTRNFLQFESL